MLAFESVTPKVDDLFGEVSTRAQAAMALKDQFYGMREFACSIRIGIS